MPNEPQIHVMPQKFRNRFFYFLVLVFILALPAFIFYTSGYRLSFEEEGTKVVTTGGIYITTEKLGVDVVLDETWVERPRLFRSAYYIQNIETGVHQVVVQGEGLQTWVKMLPVDPYIVTEASAFNMPVVPNIRPVPEFTTQDGQGVFFARSTSTELFPNTTSTAEYIITTKRATTTYNANQEFDYVESLFIATSTASSSSLLTRIGQEIGRFQFSTTTNATGATTTIIYPYIERGNTRLVDKGEELYATWAGNSNNIPYYFCVTGDDAADIAERYGDHVAAQVEIHRLSTTNPILIDGARFCRKEIRIDRKWQTIKYFEFFPGTSDLVILQLDDGLFVTEIDDRAWQNTQMIYPGSNFETIVTDDNIFIKENNRYFELLTDIEES